MTDINFNKLTAAQTERLAILSEELGEAQQAIGKIMRHGYDSCNPLLGNDDERAHVNRIAFEKYGLGWMGWRVKLDGNCGECYASSMHLKGTS